jgi:hypothetical protein
MLSHSWWFSVPDYTVLAHIIVKFHAVVHSKFLSSLSVHAFVFLSSYSESDILSNM